LFASLIPLASVRDGAAGHETDEEKRQRIEHEEHVKTQQVKLFRKLEIVMLQQG
jgi:predicted amidohydrolase YtcJ